MSLFSKSKEPENAPEVAIVFEIDRGYDQRLIGNSRPVSIYVDGEHVATLAAGESQEVRVKAGKRKIVIAHKNGKTHMSRNIDGSSHCFIGEDKEGVEVSWNGSNIFGAIRGEKKAMASSGKEAKILFHAEAGLTGRDRTVEIKIDGAPVATLRTGERCQHAVETGTHVFEFSGTIIRQVVQEDTGCFIQLGKKVEVQFFDPKSLLYKNLLRWDPGCRPQKNRPETAYLKCPYAPDGFLCSTGWIWASHEQSIQLNLYNLILHL